MGSTQPYAGFLSSAEMYDEAEMFWADLLAAPGWEVGWLNTVFVNGAPMRDGNPIGSSISKRMGRAVRVIQEDGESPDISGWVKLVESVHGPIEELVVHLVATNAAIAQARGCLTEWMQGGSAEESLKYLGEPGTPASE